ncbi:MAG: tRNA (guanosine(46)-N7)-methyltransferase TrmB [Kiritimatiellaeota bacterium]|nr:tRNA (guanosine(46)-N7)-methyltransferase TrmB [Kiritimatiellota bacterium]
MIPVDETPSRDEQPDGARAPRVFLPCEIPVLDPTAPLQLDALCGAAPLEIEVGCGNGRFLASRAAKHPDTHYIGIERMLGRARKLSRKAERLPARNVHVLRLEAFYTFYYLLPEHRLRAVYAFFPDPWPKRHHHRHRLFAPLFLDALWMRLEPGGTIQVATDHQAYFEEIRKRFQASPRFREIPPMTRTEDERTDFEQRFLAEGLPVGACAFQSLPGVPIRLPPLTLDPDMLPRGAEGE